MGRIVLLKEAAALEGLSMHELRTGALSGKYPSMRIGGPRGKLVFDIGLLQERIRELMLENVKKFNESEIYNGIRRIQ